MLVTAQVWVEEASEHRRAKKCLLFCYVIKSKANLFCSLIEDAAEKQHGFTCVQLTSWNLFSCVCDNETYSLKVEICFLNQV